MDSASTAPTATRIVAPCAAGPMLPPAPGARQTDGRRRGSQRAGDISERAGPRRGKREVPRHGSPDLGVGLPDLTRTRPATRSRYHGARTTAAGPTIA